MMSERGRRTFVLRPARQPHMADPRTSGAITRLAPARACREIWPRGTPRQALRRAPWQAQKHVCASSQQKHGSSTSSTSSCFTTDSTQHSHTHTRWRAAAWRGPERARPAARQSRTSLQVILDRSATAFSYTAAPATATATAPTPAPAPAPAARSLQRAAFLWGREDTRYNTTHGVTIPHASHTSRRACAPPHTAGTQTTQQSEVPRMVCGPDGSGPRGARGRPETGRR